MSIFRSGHDCLLDGHRFEARYDVAPGDLDAHGVSLAGLERLVQSAMKRTYVRDVCVRCGKTIERSGPA
jgi:hypothetical protein